MKGIKIMEKKKLIFGLMAAMLLPGIVSCGSVQKTNHSSDLNEKVAYDALLKNVKRNAATEYTSFGENISPVLLREGTNLKLQFQFTEAYFNQLVTTEETSQKVTVYYGMTIDGSEKTAEEIINANVATQDFELNKGGLISLNFTNRNTAKYANNLYQAVLVANINNVDYCSSVIYGQYAGVEYSGTVVVDGTADFKFQAKNMKLEGSGEVRNGLYPEDTNNSTKLTQEFEVKNGGGFYKVSVNAADPIADEKDFVAYFADINRKNEEVVPSIYAPITNIKTGDWVEFTKTTIFDYIYLAEGTHTFHLDGIDNEKDDKSMCNLKEVIFERVDLANVADAKAIDLSKKYNVIKGNDINQVYVESVQSTYMQSGNGFDFIGYTYGFAQPILLTEAAEMEMTINYASQYTGSLSLFIDGQDTGRDLEFTSTGKWDGDFHNNVSISLGNLAAGNHIVELRKNTTDSSMNIYSLSFSKATSLDRYTGSDLLISATIAPEVTNIAGEGNDAHVEFTPNVLTYQFYSEVEELVDVSLEYACGSGNPSNASINGTPLSLPDTGGWSVFKESDKIGIYVKKGVNTIIFSGAGNNCNPKNLILKSNPYNYNGNETMRIEAEDAIDANIGKVTTNNGRTYIENTPSPLTYKFNSSVSGEAYVRLLYTSAGAPTSKINDNDVSLVWTGSWDNNFSYSNDVKINVVKGENTIVLTNNHDFNPDYLEVSPIMATKQTGSDASELKYRFEDSVYDQSKVTKNESGNLIAQVGAKFTFYVNINEGEGNRRFFFNLNNWEGRRIRVTVNDQSKEFDVNANWGWMSVENDVDKMLFKDGLNTVTVELISGENGMEFILFGVNRRVA